MPPSPTLVGRLHRRELLSLVATAAVACSATTGARRPAAVTTVRDRRPGRGSGSASSRLVRILLSSRLPVVRLSADRGWRMYASDGQTLLALPEPGEQWLLELDGRLVSARRVDSGPVPLRQSPIVVRPTEGDGTIAFNGKRWRGELLVSWGEGGMTVVNRLPMDDYLRGVVPLEIGTTALAAAAAVEAQAVTARSYALTHLAGPARAWDMTATVQDQVYGGASAETAGGNVAIDATSGLVLLYAGRIVNAPYHANCGGSTAEPQDSWRATGEPYLRRVSDQIPGTTRFYCDQAPRFRWTRTFRGDELRQLIGRYVRTLPGGAGGIGAVTGVEVTTVTPGGRVGVLTVETDRGRWALRGNDIRSALRSPAGDLLYSTYFSVETTDGRAGVDSLVLRGGGNGHGIGMCQSGALGRARAGHDFRTILGTYYPGSSVGQVE